MSGIIKCWTHEIREADCPKCMSETHPERAIAMTTYDKLAVSQEAREAAAKLIVSDYDAAVVRDGEHDEHIYVQAFARVIAQARAAGERAGMEKAAQFVREWNGDTAGGNTFFIADALDEQAASTGEIG